MDTAEASSKQVHGGVHSHEGVQLVQPSFHGAVNFSHGSNHVLPEYASTIPRTINRRLYTGRQEIADRLADAFNTDTQSYAEGVRVFVIIGLGGTGKSEICLKFAEDNSKRYWGRFYKHLAQQCNLNLSEVDEIRWKLSSCGRRWLLVLDNADDPGIDLQDYVPPGGSGDVIITTRNSECSEHATVGVESLEGLNDELSRELLLKVAGTQSQNEEVEIESATKVVRILDRHTLALVQAGAYIKNGLCTLGEYPGLYEQQKSEILKYTRQQQKSNYNSVFATFEVSAKWLERASASKSEDAKSSEDALHLLHVLSFMHRSGQIERIFAEAAVYADAILSNAERTAERKPPKSKLTHYHALQLPWYAPRKWRGTAGFLRWRKACNMLKRFSLITLKRTGHGEDLSLHPLVHEWARERQDYDSRHAIWISTACVLALACGGKLAYVSIFATIRSHLRSCVTEDVQKHIYKLDRFAAFQLLYQLAWVLYENFEDRPLAILLELMRHLLQEESKTSEMLVNAEYLFAVSKQRMGKIDEAVELLEHVVQVDKSRLDEADPDRLASQKTLAGAYLQKGQTLEAIKILEYVVQIAESRLKESHPDRVSSQRKLAKAYRASGQIAKSTKILKHVAHVRETSLEEDHPDRLLSQHELGLAYLSASQFAEAVKLLEQVVRVDRFAPGRDHVDQLVSKNALAEAYIGVGQVQRAISMLEHALRSTELNLGVDHPDTEKTRKLLERARRELLRS